jgi:hypothetical protein
MKELPKYFVIKREENKPLWKDYIDWLNKKYNQNNRGGSFEFYGIDGSKVYQGLNHHDDIEDFQNSPALITLEEWNECVNLKENNMEKKNRTITAQQAQIIIDIACAEWKEKLIKRYSRQICLKCDSTVTEEQYKEMRSACSKPQHKLFDEIFGKDEKEFTSDNLCDTETMVSGTFVFMRLNDRIINLNTGDSFHKNADEKVIGKKVKIKSIQWEEVKSDVPSYCNSH